MSAEAWMFLILIHIFYQILTWTKYMLKNASLGLGFHLEGFRVQISVLRRFWKNFQAKFEPRYSYKIVLIKKSALPCIVVSHVYIFYKKVRVWALKNFAKQPKIIFFADHNPIFYHNYNS